MAGSELELRPVDFVTIDTIGPKGKRVFYLQAGKEAQIVTLIIEKEQALALSEAIGELLDDIDERFPPPGEETDSAVGADDMELREPWSRSFASPKWDWAMTTRPVWWCCWPGTGGA